MRNLVDPELDRVNLLRGGERKPKESNYNDNSDQLLESQSLLFKGMLSNYLAHR